MKYKKISIAFLAIIIILILILIPLSWDKIKCQYNAPYIEAMSKTNTPLCSKKDDNCRIVNLNELIKNSNGTGKIFYLKLSNNKKSVYHLIICNQNNMIIDKKNLIKNKTLCNIEPVEANVTHEVLASSNVKNNIIIDTKYENISSLDFLHTLLGVRYTKIYLKQKQIVD